MPTRDQFLASPGLVPQDGEHDCMICYETASEPVTTSPCGCRVVYCRECILLWFGSSNKCPTCDFRSYEIADENELTFWKFLQALWNELTFWKLLLALWNALMMLMDLYCIIIALTQTSSQPRFRRNPRMRYVV
ncbi:hypothetical protein CKM354_001271200 [Cercospora kikuchii]|uniref:RING-type domain-containing protein n=1 Tax=Cercospora kikuchii TaxID=84275 RepID=A0A9P3FMG9_9PEZI|nr:uncharacterized protein CKM354_001271200 [Cercospora kikuchii]GIZ49685.1 hypothetical protein CKM354_001271200 [Cercospora kikuchii]